MYFTHHFAHHDTLSRARTWLTQLGFEPRPTEPRTDGIPRIVMIVDRDRLDAVNMLINAVERSDPDGFPSFWEQARQPHCAPRAIPDEAQADGVGPRKAVIGWHPID